MSVDALVDLYLFVCVFIFFFLSQAASLLHELKQPDDNISYSDLISM